MKRAGVMAAAVAGSTAATLVPALVADAVGCHVPWDLVATIGAFEVLGAAGVTFTTYTWHEAQEALSWEVARHLSHLDGVIVWAARPDGSLVFSVGGELRKHWRDVAPEGIQQSKLHLRHFGDVPERDDGLARARRAGRATWVVDVAGVTWLSWARRVGGVVVVLTVDATEVANLVRSRIVSRALGGDRATGS